MLSPGSNRICLSLRRFTGLAPGLVQLQVQLDHRLSILIMSELLEDKYRKFGLGFYVAEGRHKERKGFPGACFSDSDQVVAFESYWPSLRLNWRRLLESFPLKLIQYLPLKLHFIKFENRIRN